jgi:polyferredoxin
VPPATRDSQRIGSLVRPRRESRMNEKPQQDTRQRELYGVAFHVLIFVTVGIVLLVVDVVSAPMTFWYGRGLLGWLLAIFLHAGLVLLIARWQRRGDG